MKECSEARLEQAHLEQAYLEQACLECSASLTRFCVCLDLIKEGSQGGLKPLGLKTFGPQEI